MGKIIMLFITMLLLIMVITMVKGEPSVGVSVFVHSLPLILLSVLWLSFWKMRFE